jgi:hypothetical protein
MKDGVNGVVNDVVAACIAQARASRKRLVLPEGHDERIVAAARRLKDDGIATPIVLGAGAEIGAAAARAGVSLEGIATLDPEESDRLGAYAGLYSAGRPGASAKVAERRVFSLSIYAWNLKRMVPQMPEPRRISVTREMTSVSLKFTCRILVYRP